MKPALAKHDDLSAKSQCLDGSLSDQPTPPDTLSTTAIENNSAGASDPVEGNEDASGILRQFLRGLERRRDEFLNPAAVQRHVIQPPPNLLDVGEDMASPRSFDDFEITNPHLQRLAEKLNTAPSTTRTGESAARLGTEVVWLLDRLVAESSHEHGEHEHGGGLGLDLDEAVHGVYALINYLIQALNGGGGEISKQFQESAHQLQSGALPYLHHAGLPEGAADLAVTWGVGSVLTPLAILAIKAGMDEVKGANHLGKALQSEIARLKRDDATLGQLQGAAVAGGQARTLPQWLRRGKQQRLEDLRFTAKQNVQDKAIGYSSIGAGLAIMGNVGTSAITKTHAVADATATATAVAGNAGVAAAPLGTVAAAASLALTGALTHKAKRKQRQFHADAAETKQRLNWLRDQGLTEADLRHLGTMIAKIDQEDDFHSSFLKGCLGLLAGAGLYTTGQVARDALLIAAATGALAASKGAALPVVLGLLLAANSGGGIIMAAFAKTLFRGHPKQARYQGYHIGDDVDLDREFVSLLDLLPKFTEEVGPLKGHKLRGMITEQWNNQEDLRQDFLGKAAQDLKLRFEGWYAYTGDKPEIVEKRMGQRTGQPPVEGMTRPRGRVIAGELARRVGEDAKGRAKALDGFATGFGSIATSSVSTARRDAENFAAEHGRESRLYRIRQGASFLGSVGRQTIERPVERARGALRPDEDKPLSAFRHLRAAKNFAKEAVKQPFSTPAARARQAWNDARPYLTATSLAGWLAEDTHVTEQLDLMSKILDQKVRVLDAKLPAKIGAYALLTKQTIEAIESDNGQGGNGMAGMDGEARQHLRKMLGTLNEKLNQEEERLHQSKALRKDVQSWLSSGIWQPASSEALSRCREKFVALQTGTSPQGGEQLTADESRIRLAEFLLKEAPKLYRDRRGKMKNTEMQVTRLMKEAELPPFASQDTAEASQA